MGLPTAPGGVGGSSDIVSSDMVSDMVSKSDSVKASWNSDSLSELDDLQLESMILQCIDL